MTTVTALPTPPSRQDPANFASRGDAFMAALPTLVTEINTVATEINAAAIDAAADAVAATMAAVSGTFVNTSTNQTVGGVKTFSSQPVLPGNASSALHAVPKQQAESIATAAVDSVFPSGTRLAFAQAAAPTGWTQDTSDNADNRMLRVVKTAGNGVAGTHSPILNNVVPAHTHGFTTGSVSADHTHYINDPGHSHLYAQGQPAVGGGASIGNTQYGNTGPTTASGTGVYTSGASSNHTHSGSTDNGSSQTNWAPRYIDLIICSKN